MLLFAKQRVIEVGLPDHVVRMYLEQSTDGLIGRMCNIIKNALQSAEPANQPTMWMGLDEYESRGGSSDFHTSPPISHAFKCYTNHVVMFGEQQRWKKMLVVICSLFACRAAQNSSSRRDSSTDVSNMSLSSK